jgi:hypothetical protein
MALRRQQMLLRGGILLHDAARAIDRLWSVNRRAARRNRAA